MLSDAAGGVDGHANVGEASAAGSMDGADGAKYDGARLTPGILPGPPCGTGSPQLRPALLTDLNLSAAASEVKLIFLNEILIVRRFRPTRPASYQLTYCGQYKSYAAVRKVGHDLGEGAG